jgi:hypothetical protein
MRNRLAFLLGIVGLLLTVVLAQETQEKTAKLRGHLGVSEDTVIKPSLAPSLPTTKPLTVALAFGLDAKVTQNFVKWVRDDWNNKGDAQKYGRIELVEDLQRADVVLVRFPTDQSRSSGAAVLPMGSGLMVVGLDRTPVSQYVLKKTATGFDVLWSQDFMSSQSATAGRDLWDKFKKMMKGK